MSAAPPLKALFINPWVVDAAAYDLWARPLGALALAGLLRSRGWQVGLIDCCDRFAPGAADVPGGRDDGAGRGKYGSIKIPPSEWYRRAGLACRRYGISEEAFVEAARGFGRPDLILVSTRMTYWYPGAAMAVGLARSLFSGVPVALGGAYATLCPDHAEAVVRPDYRIGGEGENALLALADGLFPGRFDATPVASGDLDALPEPAWDLSHSRRWPAVMLSRGCPMACAYCASGRLYDGYRRRDPGRMVEALLRMRRDHGVTDVAFYDDALLAGADSGFAPLADGLIAAGAPLRLHFPNGLHAPSIDDDLAARLWAAGGDTIRVSLETADADHLKRLGRGGGTERFAAALAALRRAGFQRDQLGVYLLAALPGQSVDEVRHSIEVAVEAGGTPLVGEYSPIPDTDTFESALAESGLPLDQEPLLHNNSLYHRLARWGGGTAIEELRRWGRLRLAQATRED